MLLTSTISQLNKKKQMTICTAWNINLKWLVWNFSEPLKGGYFCPENTCFPTCSVIQRMLSNQLSNKDTFNGDFLTILKTILLSYNHCLFTHPDATVREKKKKYNTWPKKLRHAMVAMCLCCQIVLISLCYLHTFSVCSSCSLLSSQGHCRKSTSQQYKAAH